MSHNTDSVWCQERYRLSDYPALDTLRLTAGDLELLSRQGSVCKERRGEKTYFKLRFRRNHQQVVRYIGDIQRAAAVKNELMKLQKGTVLRRELKSQMKVASQEIRTAKKRLKPMLEANGFAFHGLAIRKSRKQ